MANWHGRFECSYVNLNQAISADNKRKDATFVLIRMQSFEGLPWLRGTKQTVSVNIGWKICYIIAYDRFSDEVSENWSFCFSSNFREMGKVMPVVFGEIKMLLCVRKKAC